MKKNKAFLLIFAVMFLVTAIFRPAVNADTSNDIGLIINDQKVKTDVSPVIVNNRTLVPVRVLFEHLNADVAWNDSLKQVTVTSPGTVMIFNIDSTVAYLNSKSVKLDAAPIIMNSRTLVPVRFISENLGYTVDWNGTTRTVFIYSETGSTPEDDKPSDDTTVGEAGNDPVGSSKKEYDGEINSVDISEGESKIKVTVSISEEIAPKVSKLSDPSRLIFDFKNVYQKCNDGKTSFDNSYPVREIRWAGHDEYARIVVESYADAEYTVNNSSSGKCVITIYKEEKPSDFDDESKKNNDASKTDSETPKKDTSAANSKTETIPLKDTFTPNHGKVTFTNGAPTVVIDAGHGGNDSGAIGRDDEGNDILYEKVLTLDIAKRVCKLLENDGIDVIMTRTKDVGLGDTVMKDLVKRCDIANEAGADLFVSVHINSFSEPTATGSSVLYAGLSTNTDYGITGEELAKNIQKNLVKATQLKDRGIVESPNIVVLKKTAMPAALVECAFISCKEDQAVLSSEIKLNDIAEAIYSGIIVSLKQAGHIK